MTPKDCAACAARPELSFDASKDGVEPEDGSLLLLERHTEERRSCPACGRMYLRTHTNADEPFLYRDVDTYSFRKLDERVTPSGPFVPRARKPAPKPRPATELVRVARCPSCGSTDVTEDRWEVGWDELRMTCEACKLVELVEGEERFRWSTWIELPIVGRVVPPFVPLDAAPAPVPEAPVVVARPKVEPASPLASAPVGCPRCLGADASSAWDAVTERPVRSFVKEPHFGVHATSCGCGTSFAVVFAERVDFGGGDDSLVALAVALRPDELEALAALRPRAVEGAVTRFAQGRRFLLKLDSSEAQWRPSGFAIGPHD